MLTILDRLPRRRLAVLVLLVLSVGGWASLGPEQASGATVQMTAIATGFNQPIGIDHHDPTNKVVMSVNYPNGLPYNFELVAADGTRTQFSSIAGLTDEVKITTVRSGPCQGGFNTGELFTGTGAAGVIARISSDGTTIQNPWVTLPGEPGLMRGSLFQDRYCSFGGDLIAVTTAGRVWQVTSSGVPTLIANIGTHLEGVTTVPNDVAKYGPWSGRILAGAEGQSRIYSIDASGNTVSFALGIQPEDIDIVPPNQNFFGVDYAGQTLWGATASEFAGMVGDFVIAQESGGILWHVRWDSASSSFQTDQIADVAQWEHVTFSSAGLPGVLPQLVADFGWQPVDPTAGKPVSFTPTVSGGMAPYSCSWDVDKNGTLEQTANCDVDFVHSFPVEGNYQVRLSVEDIPTPHVPFKGALCPEGLADRAAVKAALSGPTYNPPGWTAAHVDAASIVTVPVADVVNGTSTFSGILQALNNAPIVGSDCRPQAAADTLQNALISYVSLGYFTLADNIHLLVYDDGSNPPSFIWMECANNSKNAPKPVPTTPPTPSATTVNKKVTVSPQPLGELTVIKTVNNVYGGTAVAGNWTMNISGTNVSSTGFPGQGTPGVTVTMEGGAYNVSESGGPPGYVATYSSECSGAMAGGDSKTCTITNNDIQPSLTVIKTVVNDHGGAALPSNWTMNVAGTNVSNVSFPGAGAPGVNVTLNAGAYNVTESDGPSGYAASFSADCSGTIAIGEDLTCTITNDDIAPQLTVIKHVINDHGGTAIAANWTMNVTGADVSSTGFSGQETPGVTVTLDAGAYSVDESGGVPNYTKSLSADCSGTIAIGESKTCTITNDDIQPSLTIIKNVVNDHGGTAVVGNWTMDIAGTDVSSTGFPGQGSPGVKIGLDAGAYSVSESGGPSGYAASFSADCSGTIAIGETKTCTITNDDIAPQLTVIKHVINDDGGTAVASDWTMDVTGTAVSSTGFPGQEAPGVTVTLNAGAYSVDESGGIANYKKTLSADCSGNINIGESKTCTITNDDNPPVLGKGLILRNVWLTRQGAKIPPPDCLSSSDIAAITEALDHPIASPDPKDPSQVQQLAAFEFEVYYDNKKVCLTLDEGTAFVAGGAVCIIEDSSTKPQLEGVARIGCVTSGKGHNINELDPLTFIDIYPQPEVYSQAKPNQDNGVVVKIQNVNCDLSDEQGHAIPISGCHDVAVTFRYLEGDVEPDCTVDAVDAQAISFRWGVEKGSLIYNEFMNLEPSGAQQDQDLDINDLQFVFGRFGSTCDSPWPAQLPVNPGP